MKRILAALLLASQAAQAADMPTVQPTTDVDVTYRVPVAGGADTSLLQRLRFSAALRTQRVDLPTSANWMVLDFARHRMALIRDDSREVVDLPAPRTADQPGAGAGYTRADTTTIAGLPCTNWRTIDTRGQETLACYTQDGILLRAAAGPRTLMEAISVKHEPQPPEIFQPPASYTHQETSR